MNRDNFREKFTKHELSKIGFKKVRGYYFLKLDKDCPGFEWVLKKDDTSANIRMLMYLDPKSTKVVNHSNPLNELKTIDDLKSACDKLKHEYRAS